MAGLEGEDLQGKTFLVSSGLPLGLKKQQVAPPSTPNSYQNFYGWLKAKYKLKPGKAAWQPCDHRPLAGSGLAVGRDGRDTQDLPSLETRDDCLPSASCSGKVNIPETGRH